MRGVCLRWEAPSGPETAEKRRAVIVRSRS
jgi:hypothetical protein